MAERRRSGRRKVAEEPAPGTALVLYEAVARESDEARDGAEPVAGLADEVAQVRTLLRRQMRKRPDDLDLIFKGMHLLVRMVTAQHKLSGGDAAELSGRLSELADQMAIAILGKEPGDGGEA